MEEVIFHPEARAELRDGAAYYEACRTALGREFLSAVDDAVRCICEHPHMGCMVRSPYRRYLVGRFPYGIIYRKSGSTIYIAAVMHLKRKPEYWRSRETVR